MQINNVRTGALEFKRAMKLMGNVFEITVVAGDKYSADECIDDAVDEIKRIERLFTTFDNNSQANQINKMAGKSAVKVDKEVFDLIQRSIRIADITQGAFDITYGSIDKTPWNFDRNMTALPDKKTARQMVHLINYKNVLLDEQSCSVMLKKEGMRIGFGGIGKGYAAEMAKKILRGKGVQSGLVNASGDLTAWGLQANKKPWAIGITNPDNPREIFSYLSISDMAIATSGNYEKYVTINGRKYSHTENPKTGLPITGIKSVSVITTNAEIADAMTTPVSIMGVVAGIDPINQMKNIGCIIIDDDNKIYTSKNVNLQ